MPSDLNKAAFRDAEASPGFANAAVQERAQGHSTCAFGSHCKNDHQHECKHPRPSRYLKSWLSSRLNLAISKGLGFCAISAVIFTPCPCCGGVLVACLRGLFSAAVGVVVGVVTYRWRPTTAIAKRSVNSRPTLSEP